jgi:hypothetical protein
MKIRAPRREVVCILGRSVGSDSFSDDEIK